MTADPATEARTIVRTLRTNLGKPIDHDTWRKVLSPAFDTVMAALPCGSRAACDTWFTREAVANCRAIACCRVCLAADTLKRPGVPHQVMLAFHPSTVYCRAKS